MINIAPDNYQSENIVSEEELTKKLDELRKQGKKIGLCTGSFDLLHPGHITHFISAKKMCDVLVIAVARDHFSSKKRPGKGRPVFSHDLRAFIVSQLKPVDFVILDDGCEETVNLIKPDIFIKGKDYAGGENPSIVRQKTLVESWGGKIGYTQDEKLSTTDIIQYIREEVE